MGEKSPNNSSKDIFAKFDISKIFAYVSYLRVKFGEKHDGDVAEPIQPTVLELWQNFMQKWSLQPPKIYDKFNFGDLRNPTTAVSSKSDKFDKLAQKVALLIGVFFSTISSNLFDLNETAIRSVSRSPNSNPS